MTSDLCWCSSIWSDETISWSFRFSSWSTRILPSAFSSWCFGEKSELQAPISSRSWIGMRIFLSLSHVVDCTRVCPLNQLILFPPGLAWSGAHVTGCDQISFLKTGFRLSTCLPACGPACGSRTFYRSCSFKKWSTLFTKIFKNITSWGGIRLSRLHITTVQNILEANFSNLPFSFRSNIIFLSHFLGMKSLDFT